MAGNWADMTRSWIFVGVDLQYYGFGKKICHAKIQIPIHSLVNEWKSGISIAVP
jgi:hypothetical protein